MEPMREQRRPDEYYNKTVVGVPVSIIFSEGDDRRHSVTLAAYNDDAHTVRTKKQIAVIQRTANELAANRGFHEGEAPAERLKLEEPCVTLPVPQNKNFEGAWEDVKAALIKTAADIRQARDERKSRGR